MEHAAMATSERTSAPGSSKSARSPSTANRYVLLAWTSIILFLAVLLRAPTHDDALEKLDQAFRSTNHAKASVLLVTAHPDDEVMFFSPTVLALVRASWDIRGLCLSAGNSSGLGNIRAQELYTSYSRLGISSDRVHLAEHPRLQDGMSHWDSLWEPAIVANVLARHLRDYPASIMITFDHHGITSHPNHAPISFSHALLPTRDRLSPNKADRPRLVVLRSPPLWAKFWGPGPALLYALTQQLPVGTLRGYFESGKGSRRGGGLHRIVFTSNARGYGRGVWAMMAHWSQLVWFRWLYIVLSRLMWMNELVLMPD